MAKQRKGAGTHLDRALDEMGEVEQLKLDLASAHERMDCLKLAIRRKDEAEMKVRQLQEQLKAARRKAKEAGWDVGLLLERARRG